MTKKLSCSLLLILICVTVALAQDLKPPKLTPAPSTEEETALIKEGVALHDRGDYDGAIAKYERVLKDNPNNVLAMYELTYSFTMKKDYRKSLEMAYKGAQYKSDSLPLFYLSIGNNLDLLGEPKKAVEVYKKGIELEPNEGLLYYNLAVTYANLKKPDEARTNLKKAVQLKPNHPSSHLALGSIFQQTGYNTPALLALSRFLVLEPKSDRSVGAFKLLHHVLMGGATRGKGSNQINVFFNVASKKDEGDFGSMDLVITLGAALAMSDANKGKSEIQKILDQENKFFAVLAEQEPKGDKSKFSWKYYIPYFIELKERNYIEPFAYYISQSNNLDGVEKWLAANETRVNEFLAWSKSYQWPKE